MQENIFDHKAIYIIDSSSLILLREYYPKDLFEPIHAKFAEILSSGKIVILDVVLDEIKDKEPEIFKFITSNVPKNRIISFGEYIDITQEIIHAYYDGKKKSHHLKADPHIIACARIEEVIIISEESNSGDTSIPYVCDKEHVQLINFVEFLRSEKVIITS